MRRTILYTWDQVHRAVNRAADDALGIATDCEEDLLNLVVGATLFYIDGTATGIHEVVAENWQGEARINNGVLEFSPFLDDDEDEEDA